VPKSPNTTPSAAKLAQPGGFPPSAVSDADPSIAVDFLFMVCTPVTESLPYCFFEPRGEETWAGTQRSLRADIQKMLRRMRTQEQTLRGRPLPSIPTTANADRPTGWGW
jgi:hypothetical protein